MSEDRQWWIDRIDDWMNGKLIDIKILKLVLNRVFKCEESVNKDLDSIQEEMNGHLEKIYEGLERLLEIIKLK